MLSKFFTAALKFLLPQVCVVCKAKAESHLCVGCRTKLPRINYGCVRCGRELTQNALICGECLKHPPPFARTIAPFFYAAPIDQLIIALKFHGRLLHAKLLGELLAEHLTEYYRDHPKPELIIPMPLHKTRLQERGFNQALEIAKPIAKKLNVPLERYHCKRIKNTAAQTSLTADERRVNVKKAFAVAHTMPAHIAVIDDVITTGSTITEFCKVLRHSGAVTIDVWCCARSHRDFNCSFPDNLSR